MTDKSNQQHWNHIFSTKQPHEVSWTQEIPTTSLDFLRAAQLPKQSRIIDVGGGDSRLVDFLLNEGFENITVLDISEAALNKTRERLGEKAKRIKWVVEDITSFIPYEIYDFWHDRSAFHFLTTPIQIETYLSTARKAVNENGSVVIGTFSTNGPQKCSGLE